MDVTMYVSIDNDKNQTSLKKTRPKLSSFDYGITYFAIDRKRPNP